MVRMTDLQRARLAKMPIRDAAIALGLSPKLAALNIVQARCQGHDHNRDLFINLETGEWGCIGCPLHGKGSASLVSAMVDGECDGIDVVRTTPRSVDRHTYDRYWLHGHERISVVIDPSKPARPHRKVQLTFITPVKTALDETLGFYIRDAGEMLHVRRCEAYLPSRRGLDLCRKATESGKAVFAVAWAILEFPKPWPLLRADEIASHGRAVSIYDAVDAAKGWEAGGVSTTWLGGLEEIEAGGGNVDWSTLFMRDVVLHPSEDGRSQRAMLRVADLVRSAGASSVQVIEPAAPIPSAPTQQGSGILVDLSEGDA